MDGVDDLDDSSDYIDLEDIQAPREVAAYWMATLESEDLTAEDRPGCLINLANALADAADTENSDALAREALRYGLLALSHPLLNQTSRPTILSNVSTIYLTIFELEGDQAALEQSISHIRRALSEDQVPGNQSLFRTINLCNTLCTSFDAFGRRKDIDEAIEAGQIAIGIDHADKDLQAKAFGNLAKAYGRRREAYFVQHDSENAIRFAHQAVSIAESQETKAINRSNLLGLMLNDAERLFSEELVAEAIDNGLSAIPDLTPSEEARCLHNMSYLLRLQYEQSHESGGKAAILQKAVDYGTESINTYPGEGPELAMFEDGLAACLEQAFLGGDHNVLSTAIELARNAVARTIGADRINASYKNHLATLLKRRALPNDLTDAINLSRSVLDAQNAALMEKINASHTAGLILVHLHKWDEAYETFTKGLDLVSKMVKDALNRSDQQYVLSHLNSLSQKATSCALLAGKSADEALSTLESGRTILTRLAILERSGLPIELGSNEAVSHLLPRYKELKAIFQRRRTASADTDTSGPRGDNADHAIYRDLQDELDKLEAEIKQLAPRPDDIISSPLSSNVLGADYAVAFNVTTISADAFIVANSRVERLPLPKMLSQDVTKYAGCMVGEDKITSCDLESYRSANRQMLQILRWLWDVAVCPVLDHLNLRVENTTKAQLPRICWIAAGPFGLFPLHAAGHHVQGSKDFLMRYACSSYSVSLQSLTWHRGELQRRLQSVQTADVRATIFTMPTTPDWPDLNLDKEVEAVQEAFPSSHVIPYPSVALVQEELHSLIIAHFACHGVSDSQDPSESRLLFQDSNRSIEGLSVYHLAEIDNSCAWLAYLSACRTADLQSIDHLDENIHIAGGFQIAGFPQVVSTLWLAEDSVAARLAGSFYGKLAGSSSFSRNTAVYALHDSILAERARSPQAVLSWAMFVIYGA